MPEFTIVMPVFNREVELRRALDSVAGQTVGDFECLVIDDCSDTPVEPIVSRYDSRFECVRAPFNGGPSAARLLGYERMKGEYLLQLDSDNEIFPWALERAKHLLGSEPRAAGVAGLYVFTSGLRTRVAAGRRLVAPADFARGVRSPCDMVGVVRRHVVEEWLRKSRGYYSAEFHQWFTFAMSHNQLVVDEPWGRYHESAIARVSTSADDRKHTDVRLFVEEHRPLVGDAPCAPLDDYLRDQWVRLRRGRRPELALVEEWMRERDLSRFSAVRRRVVQQVGRRRTAVL